MNTSPTEIARAALEANPPGQWFYVPGEPAYRIQIALNQVAGRMNHIASVTTRTRNGVVSACWFPKEAGE